MITTAGKYTSIDSAALRPNLPRSARQATRRPAVRTGRQLHGLYLPTLTGSATVLRDWYWRELKEGGQLYNYLQREKASLPKAMRLAGRIMHGFKQNPKSDFQRLAAIPAKLYHRWKTVDEQFFDDDNNLRSLKRDNPDLPIYVPPRQLPTTRLRKTYGVGASRCDDRTAQRAVPTTETK
jgi:hypothetical protein